MIAVPSISVRSLAAFRVAIGLGLAAVLLAEPFSHVPRDEQRHYSGIDLDAIHAIAERPAAVRTVHAVAILAACIFAVGLRPRQTYAVLVLAVVLLVLVRLERFSAHDWGVPLVTMFGWLTVPWNAPAGQDRRRGFAVWWPGLTIGLAMAAAAYAKLVATGGAWITTGAVRYHFVMDAPSPSSPGLWVAAHEPVAIALSVATIVFEALFLWVIFLRSPAMRLLAGAAAAAFMLGLAVFQGVVWWPWWWLLLAFLPWQWLATGTTAQPLEQPSRAQQVAIVIVLTVQLVASAGRIEREPFVSHFPMYSHTYASPAAFDAAMAWRFTHVNAANADGAHFTRTFHALREDDQRALLALAEHPGAPQDLTRLCTDVARLHGSVPASVTFAATRSGFDWTAGRFRIPVPLSLSAVPLHALCARH